MSTPTEDWLNHAHCPSNSTNPLRTRCKLIPYCLGICRLISINIQRPLCGKSRFQNLVKCRICHTTLINACDRPPQPLKSRSNCFWWWWEKFDGAEGDRRLVWTHIMAIRFRPNPASPQGIWVLYRQANNTYKQSIAILSRSLYILLPGNTWRFCQRGFKHEIDKYYHIHLQKMK